MLVLVFDCLYIHSGHSDINLALPEREQTGGDWRYDCRLLSKKPILSPAISTVRLHQDRNCDLSAFSRNLANISRTHSLDRAALELATSRVLLQHE